MGQDGGGDLEAVEFVLVLVLRADAHTGGVELKSKLSGVAGIAGEANGRMRLPSDLGAARLGADVLVCRRAVGEYLRQWRRSRILTRR